MRTTATPPQLRIGDTATVDARVSLGHCRTPLYLRGKTGTIADILGSFRNPEQLAYRTAGLPERILYKVRFRQCDIWPAYCGPECDTLDADIFEHWLRPAAEG